MLICTHCMHKLSQIYDTNIAQILLKFQNEKRISSKNYSERFKIDAKFVHVIKLNFGGHLKGQTLEEAWTM